MLNADCLYCARWRGTRTPHIIVLALPLPERKLIERIRAQASAYRRRKSAPARILAGIGDDCSVLRIPSVHDTLVTTDFSLEGVHFRREWHPPESVGHRCLARGLSDIAAMGGEPVAAFVSLALPPEIRQTWVDRFFRGLLKLAKAFNVQLAGGDIAQSPNGVLADIIVIGSAPKNQAVLRSGARPGDLIYVTGELGASAATLDLLRADAKKITARFFPRHFFPLPRIKVARILREKAIATSMIDISDGLSTDLRHICDESSVGAGIWGNAIPRARIGKPAREVDLNLALHGGEDYELIFTARPATRVPASIAGVRITPIGKVIRKGMFILGPSGRREKFHPQGWEHFQQASPDK